MNVVGDLVTFRDLGGDGLGEAAHRPDPDLVQSLAVDGARVEVRQEPHDPPGLRRMLDQVDELGDRLRRCRPDPAVSISLDDARRDVASDKALEHLLGSRR